MGVVTRTFTTLTALAITTTPVAAQTLNTATRDEQCLAAAIYHEAKGESVMGQGMVAAVILNRVDQSKWPDTICDVVKQPKQFTFDHSARYDLDFETLAVLMLQGEWVIPESPATHFYAATIGTPDYISRGGFTCDRVDGHYFCWKG
jgi:spore germination cell wall hydrolase CwlJ-like protein